MSWTDERVDLLKKMWTEGQSASQIAKELGGVTRNAVIGKVHRLGLSNRVGGPLGAPAADPVATEAEPPRAATPATADISTPADDADTAHTAPRMARPVAIETIPAALPAAEDSDIVDTVDDDADDAAPQRMPMSAARRAIIPAGQPLPPQPSANEISPEALAKVNEVEKHAKKLTLMELTERTCKWPVGDPATPDFWFCGLPVQAGKPYCDAHVGVAFQPMSARRDRKR